MISEVSVHGWPSHFGFYGETEHHGGAACDMGVSQETKRESSLL
jgi:hypothetical protein